MDKENIKIVKEALKSEISPLLIGLREDLEQLFENGIPLQRGKDGAPGKDGETPTKEKLLSLIVPLIPKVKDGARGPRGFRGPEGKSIQGPQGKDGKRGEKGEKGDKGDIIVRTPTAEEIRNLLETLKGKSRLSATAIDGLVDLVSRIVQQMGPMYVGGTGSSGGSTVTTGLSSVSHDSTLTGDGTANNPLSVVGGAGAVNVYNEVVSFSGTSGSLAHTPTAGTVRLYKNGGRLLPGNGNDYTISGGNITLTLAAIPSDQFLADYSH